MGWTWCAAHKVDVGKVAARSFTVKLRATGVTRFRLQTWLFIRLLKFTHWITRINTEVDLEIT